MTNAGSAEPLCLYLILDVYTVEQKWNIFKSTIHRLVSQYVPLKKPYKKK